MTPTFIIGIQDFDHDRVAEIELRLRKLSAGHFHEVDTALEEDYLSYIISFNGTRRELQGRLDKAEIGSVVVLEMDRRLLGPIAGDEYFLRTLHEDIEILKARQAALEFITLLNTIHQGPMSIIALLKGMENRETDSQIGTTSIFREATEEAFNYFQR
ncbi:MAG: hypothetical protein OXI24_21380, partial [Candidatus Poribacteria bacterium]|nr:hypothetical protein [Candidatus Poribacteria bacterium]